MEIKTANREARKETANAFSNPSSVASYADPGVIPSRGEHVVSEKIERSGRKRRGEMKGGGPVVRMR